MRLKAQYSIFFTVIFCVIVSLGAFSFYQATRIWQEIKGLYTHPLAVTQTIETIRANILIIHRAMKDLTLAGLSGTSNTLLHDIEIRDEETIDDIEILYEKYLGEKSDIDKLRLAFIDWRTIREITMGILKTGDWLSAAQRTLPNGPGGAHVDKLIGYVDTIERFAASRADEFFETASRNKDMLLRRLVILSSFATLILFATTFLLMRSTLYPLLTLTNAARSFGRGEMNSRCEFSASNELGELATAFNDMAKSIKSEMDVRLASSEAIKTLVIANDPDKFFSDVVRTLVSATNSQMGALIQYNPGNGLYEHKTSIGYLPDGIVSFKATDFEGELGLSLTNRSIHVLKIGSDGLKAGFKTSFGNIALQEIVNVPLYWGNDMLGFITLGRTDAYPEETIRVLQSIHEILSAEMGSMVAHKKTIDLTDLLRRGNYELEIQARELELQASELTSQNNELESQKKKLNDANRHKSIFLSNMSHELRTPLNSIIALSSVLSRRLKGRLSSDEVEYMETVERNGKHLLSVINDILDISRIEAGKEMVSFGRINPNATIEEVVSMLKPQAEVKSLRLVTQFDEDIPQIVTDEAKLKRILINLVGNAIKFTEIGEVKISCAIKNENLIIRVADTGIGIVNENLESIFDEFKQADESSSKIFGGTGLGLAIARKYASLINAKIEVTSQLGRGSTFSLIMPAGKQGDTQNDGRPDSDLRTIGHGEDATISGSGRRLLLIEDDEAAILQIKDIFEEEGFLVDVIRNGKEAVEQVKSLRPDVIVLDLMMPVTDGFQVLDAIKNAKGEFEIPIIVLTAKLVSQEELLFLKENNVKQLIQKGDISREDLLKAVCNLLS